MGRSRVGVGSARHRTLHGGRLGFSFGCCALAAVIRCLRISGAERIEKEKSGGDDIRIWVDYKLVCNY